MSAKAIGTPATNAPNLDAKKDKGSTNTYAIIVFIFILIKANTRLTRRLWRVAVEV
jgi:hypothetical protein